MEFEPLAFETLKSKLEQLNKWGFQIEVFGRNIYRIESIPAWLSTNQAEQFLRDYVDQVRLRGGSSQQGSADLETLAELAVRDSYRRNDSLTELSVQQLATELLTCESPHTSPTGKATFSKIDWSEWGRRFGDG